MIVNKANTYITFDTDTKQWIFPLKAIIFIVNNDCRTINVRLKASNEDVLAFDYRELGNGFASAKEAIAYLSDLSNN